MYESPITQYIGEMQTKMENDLMVTVQQEFGYKIDRDALLRALKYDRDQYQKGYNDAFMNIVEELKRIAYNDGLINCDGELINQIEDYSNFEIEVISRLFNR